MVKRKKNNDKPSFIKRWLDIWRYKHIASVVTTYFQMTDNNNETLDGQLHLDMWGDHNMRAGPDLVWYIANFVYNNYDDTQHYAGYT